MGVRGLVRPLRLWVLVAVWALATLAAGVASAQQPVPPLAGPLTDPAGLLTAPQRDTVQARLLAQEAATGTQIVVLLVRTTQPEDIAAYAWRVADQWKVGRREVGDGVLVVLATDDRTIRIEVAKALEGAIPDLAARRVIDEAMVPALRQGDTAAALTAAVDRLEGLVRGEGLPPPPASTGSPGPGSTGLDPDDLVMFFFVVVAGAAQLLTRVLGRRLGGLVAAGGAGAIAWVLSHSLWIAGGVAAVAWIVVGLLGVGGALQAAGGRGGRVGWGGGSGGWRSGGGGGGGGWSSGGGGNFGGGGASGRW